MPIRQFFYFDAIECLPENVFQASNEPTAPSKIPTKKSSRYYSQEVVFGEDFQEQLGQSKYFVVRIQSPSNDFQRFIFSRLVLVQLVVKC
jgi:ubiquitin-activating enzyme E1